VITIAKHELKAGDVIDGIGGFQSYGMIENTDVARGENLLPMGLAEDCRVKKDISKDSAISLDDVELPQGRLCDQLWKEQIEYFSL
jgi:predicted homoserine dehydrogenase-like protein